MNGIASHAGLWTGTAASWIDLHPAGSTSSIAYGTSGSQQVGRAIVGLVGRASLWTGSAASWIDLHPAGSTHSHALATSGANQVGAAIIGGVNRAGLWSGTAGSWVDLSPAGALHSSAAGVADAHQAGTAFVGGRNRASFWTGTAASWEDLSLSLTGSWGDTFANSVWGDATTLYIAGWGMNLTTDREEALLWTRPIPAPGAAALLGLCGVIAARRRRA